MSPPKETRVVTTITTITTTTTAILLLLLLIAARPALGFDSDFSFYPKTSQSCLYLASASAKCTGKDAVELNSCLCGNDGDFVTSTARCMGQNDQAELQTVYNTMSEACNNSKTPIALSEKEFFDAAVEQYGTSKSTSSAWSTSSTSSSTTSSTTSSISSSSHTSATSTSTPGSSGDAKSSSDGLSKPATIGIAVGSTAAGVIAITAAILFFLRRRKSQSKSESHPMLTPSGEYFRNANDAPSTFPPTEPSPDFGRWGADLKPAWASSPPPGGFQSPAVSPGPPHPGHLSDAFTISSTSGYEHGVVPQTFEMDGEATSTRQRLDAVEMEGSPSVGP